MVEPLEFESHRFPAPSAEREIIDGGRRQISHQQLILHMRESGRSLKAYATMLLGSPDEADDLVQDTLLRAWRYRASFRRGVNPRAWLFQIMRNAFFAVRNRRRQIEDPDGAMAARMVAPANQEAWLECAEALRALPRLTPLCGEALALAASGMSYEEAAAASCCSLGTMKSRLNRARRALLEELGEAP